MKLFIFVQVHYYIFNNMTSMILKDSRKLQNYSLKYGAKVFVQVMKSSVAQCDNDCMTAMT